MIKSVVFCSIILLLTQTGNAASFDCAKAGTKVEKMICSDPELSKLDDELGKAYSKAIDLFSSSPFASEKGLRKQQRKWLKKRNKCTDVKCLVPLYQEQIAFIGRVTANAQKVERVIGDRKKVFAQVNTDGEERYSLVMSKDDELCRHMLDLFNSDLKKFGPTGDAHQIEHEEFKRIPWKPGKYFNTYPGSKRIEYSDIEGAVFDFNNDGTDDFVVRWKTIFVNVRSDSLYILDKDIAKELNNLDHEKYLFKTKNKISLAGYIYPLKELLPDIDQFLGDPRVLEPLIYKDKSFLLLRPPFEERKTESGYAVIAKYNHGRFSGRDLSGDMEDICYYARTRAH